MADRGDQPSIGTCCPGAAALGDAASTSGQAGMGVEQLALPTRGAEREPPRARPLGSDFVAPIVIGVVYFTLAYLGLRFASINSSATPIWPPTGFAIAAILLWGYRLRLPSLLPPF